MTNDGYIKFLIAHLKRMDKSDIVFLRQLCTLVRNHEEKKRRQP